MAGDVPYVTPAQLERVAEWMGGTRLFSATEVIVQPGYRDKWYFESPGFYPVWSDGDLLIALLETAARKGVDFILVQSDHLCHVSINYSTGMASRTATNATLAALLAVAAMQEGEKHE